MKVTLPTTPPRPVPNPLVKKRSKDFPMVCRPKGAFLLYPDDQLKAIVFDSIYEVAEWADDFEMLYDLTEDWREPSKIDAHQFSDAMDSWSEMVVKYGDKVPLAINRRMKAICYYRGVPIPASVDNSMV